MKWIPLKRKTSTSNSEAMLKRLFFFLLLTTSALQVRAEYFTITHYQVNVVFTEEGYADFDEVIEVAFSERRHGIFRAIPLKSVVNGKDVTRIIRNIRVEGFHFSTDKEHNNLVLKIGDADKWVEGHQTYRIRYRVLNPLNFFEDHTEFYWDMLGISWPVEVNEFDFDIAFPKRIVLLNSDVRCYTGISGSTAKNAVWQTQDNRITGRTSQKLMPGEGVTLAVNLPKNAFKKMSIWSYFLEQHGILLAPFYFLLAGILALFFARNRKQPMMVEYFPPKGVSPAIAGGFIDHSVDNNDVLCLIPYLANKGYLRMEMKEGGFLQKDHIIFFKLKEAGEDLMAFERAFLNGLFETGDQVALKDLKNKFYKHLSSVRSSVSSWIQAQGWYEPDQKIMALITGLAGVGALIWGGYTLVAQKNVDGIALVITGFVMFFFASKFNKRTPAGNLTYQKYEGFRQFIKKAERPVIEKLLQEDPHYYDKTMPYALAFGYLAKWNQRFDGLLAQPPSWYSSPGIRNQSGLQHSWSSFAESFPDEVDNIGSVFSSSPSSSSSGGGSGGSSGGGGGGGGGGSW